MLISHQHKFITIDIPKTGTRSFRESLYPLGIVDIYGEAKLDSEFYQHDKSSKAKIQFEKNNWDWINYFKFTIVRNPWDRYFSFFKYFKRKSERYRDSKLMGDYLNSKSNVWKNSGLYQNWINQEINDCKQSFNIFSSSKDDQTAFKKIILNNDEQDSYYCDNNKNIIVDHIASFENLNNEFIFLCDQIDIKTPNLKHSNKSSNSEKKHEIYNQELIDLVAQKEVGVIDLKNYQF